MNTVYRTIDRLKSCVAFGKIPGEYEEIKERNISHEGIVEITVSIRRIKLSGKDEVCKEIRRYLVDNLNEYKNSLIAAYRLDDEKIETEIIDNIVNPIQESQDLENILDMNVDALREAALTQYGSAAFSERRKRSQSN